jgi:hypothetical protein
MIRLRGRDQEGREFISYIHSHATAMDALRKYGAESVQGAVEAHLFEEQVRYANVGYIMRLFLDNALTDRVLLTALPNDVARWCAQEAANDDYASEGDKDPQSLQHVDREWVRERLDGSYQMIRYLTAARAALSAVLTK